MKQKMNYRTKRQNGNVSNYVNTWENRKKSETINNYVNDLDQKDNGISRHNLNIDRKRQKILNNDCLSQFNQVLVKIGNRIEQILKNSSSFQESKYDINQI